MIRTLQAGEKAYENMELVAKALTLFSPNKRVYEVEDTYFDFGANMKWTTICYDAGWCGVQILNPNQWEMITTAETPKELYEAIEDIRGDKYFSDNYM